jgi:5-methylcytosine-specific restriction protein A
VTPLSSAPGHSRPPQPCAEPGCGALTRSNRCPAHEKAYEKAQETRRGSATARGYDRTWQRLSRAVRADEPLCRLCAREGRTTPATLVDHIVPLRERPDLRLVRSNLQPLCASCHSGVKQAQEAADRKAGRAHDDGARRPRRWWE